MPGLCFLFTKFCSVSLSDFIEHKLLISEECEAIEISCKQRLKIGWGKNILKSFFSSYVVALGYLFLPFLNLLNAF